MSDEEIPEPIPNTFRRPRLMGRGQLISPCEALGPAVIDLIRAGIPQQRASEAVGLNRNTVGGWVRRGLVEQNRIENGEEPDEQEAPYYQFVQDLLKAEAEAQSGLVLAWYKEARQGDWKAAERFLAKRWPQEWGDNNTVKLQVSTNGEIAEPAGSPEDDDEKKRQILEALVEAGDLPMDVLSAWKTEEIIDTEEVPNEQRPEGETEGAD